MIDVPLLLSVLGSIAGIAAIILQFRKQKKDEVMEELRLKLDHKALEINADDVTGEQLAKISTLSVSLLAPLQSQLDTLSKRVEVVEAQSSKYRRWIAELVIVIQKLVLLLEDVGTNVNIHQELLREVLSDPSVQAAFTALDGTSQDTQETPDAQVG